MRRNFVVEVPVTALRDGLPDREVSERSAARVEREAALAWAARSEACQKRAAAEARAAGARGCPEAAEAALGWLVRAERYRDEALEHAAMAGDGGRLVGRLERRLAGAARPRRKTRKGGRR